MQAQRDQRLDQCLHLLRKHARQRAHCRARGIGRTGFDQVGNGFGLRKVELVVEEGTFGKFTGARQPRTQCQHAAQQQVEHHRTAMALQLEDVLAGEGMRSLEKNREPLVEHAAIVVMERREQGMARWQAVAALQHGLADGQRARAGDAHDADTAAARRGGNGGNRVRRFADAVLMRFYRQCGSRMPL